MLRQSKASSVVLALQPPLHVNIVRERRRSLALRVFPGPVGDLKVPLGYSDSLAMAFLEKKRSWILRQIHRLETHTVPDSEYFSGTPIWYLGQVLSLQIAYRELKKPTVSLLGRNLILEGPITMSKQDRQLAIYTWLRARAADILSDRVGVYAEKIGKMPKRICVKTLRSKWGSCSSMGTINLRWNLIMAPLDVLDYVVIHELCHLYFPHHRPSFWAFVALHCPDYVQAKQWLKTHAACLELPNVITH
jgi:predicted metal-dependent hydrolase